MEGIAIIILWKSLRISGKWALHPNVSTLFIRKTAGTWEAGRDERLEVMEIEKAYLRNKALNAGDYSLSVSDGFYYFHQTEWHRWNIRILVPRLNVFQDTFGHEQCQGWKDVPLRHILSSSSIGIIRRALCHSSKASSQDCPSWPTPLRTYQCCGIFFKREVVFRKTC